MSEKKGSISFIAVGDIRIFRNDMEHVFDLVAPTFKEGDIVFAQLEASYSEKIQSSSDSGRSSKGNPKMLQVVADSGINLISVASNHTLDYGPDPFIDTIESLNHKGVKVIGGGKNIKEARTPALYEMDGTKIAVLGYNAILQPHWEAREDSPGQAPLKVKTFYEQIDWQAGTPPRIWTIPVEADVKAIENDIAKTRKMADVVIVSIHWGVHHMPDPAMYQSEVGHRVIDAGADLLLGHHTHRLNPIEKYKGKYIFYGLGNFAFEHTKDSKDPYFLFTRQLYSSRLPDASKEINESHAIIVKVDIADKKLQRLSFKPSTANDKSEPRMVSPGEQAGKELIGYLERSSKDLGVRLIVEGDEVVVQ
jgi:hypothetical protein